MGILLGTSLGENWPGDRTEKGNAISHKLIEELGCPFIHALLSSRFKLSSSCSK